MSTKLIKPIELFPEGRIFEYFLQRLRLMISRKEHAFEIAELSDLPEVADRDGFPCIEVKLRVRGLKLTNPATGMPLLSRARLQQCIEGPPMQEAFLKEFAKYVADCIPPSSPERRLKAKFDTLDEGRSGTLPTRADLKLLYDRIKLEVTAIRNYVRKNPSSHSRALSQPNSEAYREANRFTWWHLIERGRIALETVAADTPSSTALQILGELYGVHEETVRSRLFRRE